METDCNHYIHNITKLNINYENAIPEYSMLPNHEFCDILASAKIIYLNDVQ